MTPSPSFPSQMSMNKPMQTPFNTTVTTPLNLNSSSFLSDLDPISNNKNRVPMNQMMSNARQTFPSAAHVNQFPNSANNSLATLNPMIPNQSNSGNRNGQESTISLSAQEINDFLS